MDNKAAKGKKSTRRTAAVAVTCVLIALSVSGIVMLSAFMVRLLSDTEQTPSVPSETVTSSEAEPAEIVKVSSATVLSTGDIMMHKPQLVGAKVPGKDEWDFSDFFKEADDYFKKADYAVANLELTFGGSQAGAYTGYPTFNTPDSLADTIKSSGLDMVLTANNHCYDTGLQGFKRTQQVLKEKGITYTGTRLSQEDAAYTVQDINGIKVGFASFTYESGRSESGIKSINGITVKAEATSLINSFSYSHLDAFYAEVDAILSAMERDGAEATVFYIHWGDEYKTSPNTMQKSIAQQLCNKGIDVIVGGHPHVIQPMDMLYAEGGEHRTVCLYSAGNAVSNQRQEAMSSIKTGHTEDGLLFYCTFDKYSDGSVVVSKVDAIPTWVNKYKVNGQNKYTIYPLEKADDGEARYGLTGTAAQKCARSYERTRTLIAESLTECQTLLGCEITFE